MMKHGERHFTLWLSLLCAVPSVASEVDFATLKTFSVIGKEEESHRAQPLEEFALCDVKGAGLLYQVTMAAQGDQKNGDNTVRDCVQ